MQQLARSTQPVVGTQGESLRAVNRCLTVEWRRNMFKSLDIRDHMEVVGSDDKHVGTVDHMQSADRILLAKDDPAAGGKHHIIAIDWVDYVDNKIHLNKPCTTAMKEWQTPA